MKSMTGFGKAKYEQDGRLYNIEIKSVNHKYCDISIRMPRCISYLEEKVKKEITSKVSRGKVDIFINFCNYSEKGRDIKINTDLAKIYIDQLRELCKQAELQDRISVTEITKFPDVLIIENSEDEQLLNTELTICLKEAIDEFIIMRENEGMKIAEDLDIRIKDISKKLEEISTYSTGLVEEYIVKLETRVKELLKTDIIDEARLNQEIVIFSDKSSIQEEITRLRSHICQFIKLIEKNEPIGKKLDFIIQEMNREINTIGSKANSLDITNLVIDIKTEIENIREQIQNIE